MKKHIIAVAVAAAVAVPATAQVRIYGSLDASAVQTDNGPYSQTSVSSGYFTSSRLGFDGSEDLGGGLKALFKLEGRLSFDGNGQLGTSTVVANGTTASTGMGVFNRDAYIGLAGGFGEVHIGTMETEVSRQQTNASGTNIGLATAAFGASFDAITGDRVPNSIRYISPNFAGLQVTVGGFQGEMNNSTAASTSSGSSYNGAQFAGVYSQGPFSARIAQTVRQAPIGTASTGRQKATVVGARYNFGMADVGIMKYTVDPGSAANNSRSATMLTFAVPVGTGLRVVGSYSALEEQTGGTAYSTSASVGGKAQALYLGAIKDLSKRTSVYAALGQMNNNADGRFTLNTGASMSTSNTDQSNYAVGIRHSF